MSRVSIAAVLLHSAAKSVDAAPFNQSYIVDDSNNYVVDDLNDRLVCYLNAYIDIEVEDGSSNPRDLVAADISYMGYWQIFGGVRATPGSITITPVDVLISDPWTSGGIISVSGLLRIHLPIAALVGDPDEIEIEITPVSGTVVLPDPIQAV